MIQEDEHARLLRQCAERAFYCYATSTIFRFRVQRIHRKRDWLTFFGLVMPLGVGATVLAVGISASWLPVVLAVASLIGIGQLAVTLWSVIAKWEEAYYAARVSEVQNYQLFEEFQRLWKYPKGDSDKLKAITENLILRDSMQQDVDIKQELTEKEKRRGHRHALLMLQLPCAACKTVPLSLKPTDCGICGNF